MKDDEKAKAYEALHKQIVENVDNWEDLYRYIDKRMADVRDTMNPFSIFDAMLTMYAFLEAMRALPEEGDIKVLTERMLQTLVYHSEERMGVEVQVLYSDGDEAEKYEKLRKAILGGGTDEAFSESATKHGRTLH